jgi:lipoprotein-anchoring transpeptidase ErfK/SrfK
VIVLFLAALLSFAPPAPVAENPYLRSELDFLKDYTDLRYSRYHLTEYLYVSVRRQKMYYVKDGAVVKEYAISTGKTGVGETNGSGCTPRGLLRIASKHGDGTPLNGVLIRDRFCGTVVPSTNHDDVNDYMTTRSLRLEGVEEGVNKGGSLDTWARAIYIHGTHEEGLIGQPVSHGCIRMMNADVVDLFSRAEKGLYVLVLSV